MTPRTDRTANRFVELIAALVMAMVLALVPISSAAAALPCPDALTHAASGHSGHAHQNGPLQHAGHHADAEQRSADHSSGTNHPCCNSGCLACTPAILMTPAGLSPFQPKIRFVAAADTFGAGLSPSPPLGPPRSRT